ncbi:MAG: hypothetical protein JNK55_20325 [Rubrivivax sp.]|nr:hypothetical protein [Rubrivivax sp.]
MTTTNAAGFGPPEKNEAGRASKQTTGPADQNQHLEFDSQEQATQAIQERDQRIGACIVRASNAGYSLHITSGHTGKPIFVVTRWGWARDFDSLQAVEDWLDRVAGVPA